jgi:DNA repair photolyase
MGEQLSFLDEDSHAHSVRGGIARTGDSALPVTIGRTEITASPSRSVLTKASGFMSDYDYTLNPYSGCSYGCTYCYAAFFARDAVKQKTWGQWVEAKANAVILISNMRRDLAGAKVYMSSVTDPYQPIERRLGLVRDILTELAHRKVRLVVQTRSPLVVRDIDLFAQFEHVRVNMTVTTDDRAVQQAFEPHCPTNSRRLGAIAKVQAAGIPCSITMTPLLPIRAPHSFAQRLRATGVTDFVVQPFHPDRGRFVAGTRDAALAEIRRLDWSLARYRETVEIFRGLLPSLTEGREGFAPT